MHGRPLILATPSKAVSPVLSAILAQNLGSESHQMLYHITPIENVPSICEVGLRANAAGQIFLFTHKMVADTIAVSQVFCRHYGLFAVYSRGVTGTLQRDEVAEACAPFQRILVGQPVIRPHHLKYLGDRQPPEGKPEPFDYYWWFRVYGWTRKEVDEYWAMKATGRSIEIDPTTKRPQPFSLWARDGDRQRQGSGERLRQGPDDNAPPISGEFPPSPTSERFILLKHE